MTNALPFGLWVKESRKALDLTQNELADRIGCSTITIKQIEAQTRRPSKQIVNLLAIQLNIPETRRSDFMLLGRGKTKIETINFPPQNTSFVGREAELAKIKELLETTSACRLVTLVGPGGIGKTRLALEVARNLVDKFSDGIVFIPLADINSSDLIIPTIMDILHISTSSTIEAITQIITFFEEKAVLLILDNFEHLLDGYELLVEMINRVPTIKILVTSRERLNIEEEWLFDVPGLSFPNQSKVQNIQSYGAVELFLQQAQKVLPTFELGESESENVARICQLVGGMPLAIELAAAWVRTLPCSSIVKSLEQNLDLLTSLRRNFLERHQSVGSVIEQSWTLLTNQEQLALKRLSVFRGGFAQDAAEHVANISTAMLAALIDKSFLHKPLNNKYDFHGLIRQYAYQRLEMDTALTRETHEKHAAYFLKLLNLQRQSLMGEGQLDSLNHIAQEIDNIRTAWQWAMTHQCYEYLEQAGESLLLFYETKGWFQEGTKVFRDTIKVLCNVETTTAKTILTQLLSAYAWCLQRVGLYAEAKSAAEESLILGDPQIHPRDWSVSKLNLGTAQIWLGEVIEAAQNLYESLAIAEQLGDSWLKAVVLQVMGLVFLNMGMYPEAKQRFEESCILFRMLMDRRLLSICQVNIGTTYLRLGDYETAKNLLEQSLELCRETDDRLGIAISILYLGVVAFEAGDLQLAKDYLIESLQLTRDNGELTGVAISLKHLGNIACLEKDYAKALHCLQESLAVCEATQNQVTRIETLIGLGNLSSEQGAYEQSRSYFHVALDLAVKNQIPFLPFPVLLGIADFFVKTQEYLGAFEILRIISEQPSATAIMKIRSAELLEKIDSLAPSLKTTDLSKKNVNDIMQKLIENNIAYN